MSDSAPPDAPPEAEIVEAPPAAAEAEAFAPAPPAEEPPPAPTPVASETEHEPVAAPVETAPEPRKKSLLAPVPTTKRQSIFDNLPEGPPAPKPTGAAAAADDLANDLAGTLHSIFGQEEKTADTGVLKPLRRPKLIYENSYRLEAHNPFHRDRVQKILDATLEEILEKVKYHSDTANDVTTKVTEKIRARVNSLRFDRYKIIVLATYGPLNRQGLHTGFRCLWDTERDSYAIGSYKNTNSFCTVAVFGIYFE